MSVPVPAGVVCAYAGIVFPAWIKTKLTEDPVTSGDNRVVKGSKLTISISGYLTQADADAMLGAAPGQPLDALMLKLRRALQVHGQRLQYVNKGYGVDLDINHPTGALGSIRDIAMGPKAGKFSWWPMGGAPDGCHGAGFEFEVSATIAECGSFPLTPGQNVFTEVSFSASYDVGEDGLVVISYSGKAEIPLSLQADNTLLQNIDDCLPNIIRPGSPCFMRKMSRQVSADRGSCTFTITDRQVELPYPADVVSIDMHCRIRQKEPLKPQWHGSFHATVRLAPNANRWKAWRVFMAIVIQRIRYIRTNGPITQVAPETADWHPEVLPGTIEMDEDVFRNESSFTWNFMIQNVPARAIIERSGLWRFIGSNAATSNTSLANNAQKTYGLVQAKFDNGKDIILDICNAVDGVGG